MWDFRIILPVFLLVIGQSNGVHWNDLRLTFSLRFPTNGFSTFPRTEQDAKEMGFLRDSASTCLNNGEFYGIRYIDPEDDFVAVLFDVQGTIAGVQLMLPESLLRERSNYRYDQVPPFQLTYRGGRRFYMLNAYFVRVETICTTGRPKCALLNEGTGTGLYFQNGHSKAMLTCPRDRATAIRTGWSDRYCVPGMGKHNYYLADRWGEDYCRRVMMQPFFGLYDQQDHLTGFGFTIERAIPNKRFEVQTKGNIEGAQGPTVPKCVLDKVDGPGITTLHVYFTNDPWRITCPGMPTLMELIKAIAKKEQDERAKFDTSNCPVVYTSKPRKGGLSSGPEGGLSSGPGGTQTIVKGSKGSSTDFVIPRSLMQTIIKMNEKVEEDSRKSVADDLPPGQTFEDVDITHAMMAHALDKNIGYVAQPNYDLQDALRLAAENNGTTVYRIVETQPQTVNSRTETKYVYNGQEIPWAEESNVETKYVYNPISPAEDNVETRVIYVNDE